MNLGSIPLKSPKNGRIWVPDGTSYIWIIRRILGIIYLGLLGNDGGNQKFNQTIPMPEVAGFPAFFFGGGGFGMLSL